MESVDGNQGAGWQSFRRGGHATFEVLGLPDCLLIQIGSNPCARIMELDFLHDNSEKEHWGVDRQRTFDVIRQNERHDSSCEMPERRGFRPAL